MRHLLYVPIIHDQADLGSAGTALAQRSAALVGDQRWAIHQETVGKFWENVAAYLRSLAPRQLKVYQDGLPIGGEAGKRIVQEAAGRGSRNYQLVLELVDKGAELRKTEDPALLLRERENIRQSAQRSAMARNLTEQRDRFIANTINATLQEGELGVLFVGAYHDVASCLAKDILVRVVKDRQKVQAYFEELFLGHDDRKLRELRQYLVAPVAVSLESGDSNEGQAGL